MHAATSGDHEHGARSVQHIARRHLLVTSLAHRLHRAVDLWVVAQDREDGADAHRSVKIA